MKTPRTIFNHLRSVVYGPIIARLASVEGDAPKVLSQLLNIEYTNLMNSVTVSPATLAIYKALDNANIQSRS